MTVQNISKFSGFGHFKFFWRKGPVKLCNHAAPIARLAEGKFTRSLLVRSMLVRFGLWPNSMVSASDEYAQKVKPLLIKSMPSAELTKEMANRIVGSLAPLSSPVGARQIYPEIFVLIYGELLRNLLGVQPLALLNQEISKLRLEDNFKSTRMGLKTQVIIYSLGLNARLSMPVRRVIDSMLFPELTRWRKISADMFAHIRDFSVPSDGGLYAEMHAMCKRGEMSPEQFRGEVTSILEASHSMSSVVTAMILCAACRPDALKGCQDPAVAKSFVMEVLRLYPPFRWYGYDSAAGETLVVNLHGLHHNPQHWAQPGQFNPARFDDPAAAGGHRYLPFGMGQRACPGRSFSMRFLVNVLEEVVAQGLSFAVPDDYRASPQGLPLHVNGPGILFFIDDDRVIVRTASQAKRELDGAREQANDLLRRKINEKRHALGTEMIGGEDLRKLKFAQALAINSYRESGSSAPINFDISLVSGYAKANGLPLFEAADRVLDACSQYETMLVDTELLKDTFAGRIALAKSLPNIQKIATEIEHL